MGGESLGGVGGGGNGLRGIPFIGNKNNFDLFKFLQSKIIFILLTSFHFCWKILIPYYQMSISCFLIDIDPRFKTSRIR